MTRRRQRLATLEHAIAEASEHATDGFWPGSTFWQHERDWLEHEAERMRARIVPADRGAA